MLLVVLVLAVVLVGTWASGALDGARPASAPGTATVASGPGRAPTAPVFTAPPAQPVPAAAITAALVWAQAFGVQPGTTRQAWLARLRPLTDPEYLGLLDAESDPASAPREVTGPATGVSAAAGSAVVDVPTDLGPLRISLVAGDTDGDTSGAWLVTQADPAGTDPAGTDPAGAGLIGAGR